MTIRHNCIIAMGLLLSGGARAQEADQYRVKAAFLYNFAKFVEWPAQSFKIPSDPIVICIDGRNPFGDTVGAAVAGKTVGGRTFQVRELIDAQHAAGCQIVFISSSERKHLKLVFESVGNPGVLTVGETDNFAAQGGVIDFKIESGSVRLQINLEAARRQRLRISPKLLSLAEIVEK